MLLVERLCWTFRMRRWEIALTQRREMIDCIIVVGRMGVKLVGGWGLVDDVLELMDVAVSLAYTVDTIPHMVPFPRNANLVW